MKKLWNKIQSDRNMEKWEFTRPKGVDTLTHGEVVLLKNPDGYGIIGKGYDTKQIGISKSDRGLIKKRYYHVKSVKNLSTAKRIVRTIKDDIEVKSEI